MEAVLIGLAVGAAFITIIYVRNARQAKRFNDMSTPEARRAPN